MGAFTNIKQRVGALLLVPVMACSMAVGVVATTGSTANALDPSSCTYTLRYGSTGYCVRVLQDSLNKFIAYYPNRLAVDGIYGPKTTAAVRGLQRTYDNCCAARYSPWLAVDGIYGPDTRYADKVLDWLAATRQMYYYIDSNMY